MMIFSFLAWSKSRYSSKFNATCRVGAYLAVVTGVAGVFCAHKAHADVSESALRFGRDMMPLSEYLQEPTPLTLNGQDMVLASGLSDKTSHEILDQYESFCRTAKDAQGANWSKLVDDQPGVKQEIATKLGGSFDMGVYRKESKGEGTVLCFMRGSESQKNLMESLQAFEATRDLGTLGKVRYAYVRTTESGRSMVFTAWTDDHFRLDAFTPEGTDDAAGSDPAGLPRPPQSQRLLAAELRNSPFGAHVYRSASTPEQVRDYYDAEMKKSGYAPLGWGDEAYLAGKNRMYLKDGVQIALSTQTEGANTIVSIGEIGSSTPLGDLAPPYETKGKLE